MKVISSVKFVVVRTWKAVGFLFLLYVFIQILLGILYTVNIFFYSAIIDTANGKKILFGLSIISIIILRLIYDIIINLIDKFREYIWNILDIKQAIYNNQDFIKRLSKLDLPTYEDPVKNDHIWRTFNRFQMQFKLYLQYLTELIQRIVMFIMIMVIFAFGSPIIALLVLITHLISLFIRAKLGEQTFTIYRADSDTRKKFESLANIVCSRETLPEIKIYNSFNFFRKQILYLYKQFTSKQLRLFKKSWIVLSIVEILPILSIFVFLVFTANQLINHKISTGIFVLLYINVFWFSSNLTQLMNSFGKLVSDSGFIQDAVDFYSLKSTILFPQLTIDKQHALINKLKSPEIVFKNISFAYPSLPEKLVLENISLSIPYGKNVALIGENGAGKSTLVKLLMRMYDPIKGNIYINGIDLKEIPEHILFLLYSTLFQTYGKFNLTIRENLNMVSDDKNGEEYIKALKISNAWNFVKNYPNTLDTQLGPQFKGGVDLSGGQWQQLAIAKAYLKKAPILILDEPTSAIDAKAEVEIFDKLIKETDRNTVLFISHRFSTIKDAERIIVLDKGRIIEDGNHEDLMKENGKYAQLYIIQAERYIRKRVKKSI